jgi:hypothetical protein
MHYLSEMLAVGFISGFVTFVILGIYEINTRYALKDDKWAEMWALIKTILTVVGITELLYFLWSQSGQ